MEWQFVMQCLESTILYIHQSVLRYSRVDGLQSGTDVPTVNGGGECSVSECNLQTRCSVSECNLQTRWYHISDSHVKEVSERTVLSSQAYLLFYERVR